MTETFPSNFEALTGNQPFPWQRALYERFVARDFPKACDLPTGLGKTSVIHLWLLALVKNPKLPRRLVYVVNRRTVVDQATAEAEKLRDFLQQPGSLRDSLTALCAEPVGDAEAPLAISTLRGERADKGEWRRDPARASIVIGTVDMIGSRLLFSGYGCGFRSKPLHAGFLGHDALLVHDEAHLEPAFQALLDAVVLAQHGPRALKVLALSATGRAAPDFELTAEDRKHAIVRARLNAKKGLQLHDLADKKLLVDTVVEHALQREGKVIVFLNTVENVERVSAELRHAKKQVQVLTGTMRGAERDKLVKTPVFARFLPAPPKDLPLAEGTVFLVSTSAGEVGIDISGDHLVTELPSFDALAQRLGRINRYGSGDALVDVVCEPLKAPPKADAEGGDDEDDEKPGKRKDALDWARYATHALLETLPRRADGLLDGSPLALRSLPAEARREASTPEPDVRAVDALLFDRWSYTTITEKLPGRPPVADWLHGVAEWEPPRTTVAWRSEVAWLTAEHIQSDSLDDFLADYPLRSREKLSDRTDRVVKQLEKISARDKDQKLRAWLVRGDESTFSSLARLLELYDAKKNPLLHDATIVLSPEAGGLRSGLLDGDVEFDATQRGLYDLGPKQDERLTLVSTDAEGDPPDGMRLAHTVRRENDEGDELYWRLFVRTKSADDDGSRTSRVKQTLRYHLTRTEHWARVIAERVGLDESQQRAVVLSGLWHDLGKKRRVWQRSIKNYTEPPLAKGPMQPSELGHYRHELGSLHDALTEADFAGLSDEERDLALHLIAAHHGRARPHFPRKESRDPEVKEAEVAELVREVPLRFDRLQRKYGRWGLAWIESLLRAADVLASKDEEDAE